MHIIKAELSKQVKYKTMNKFLNILNRILTGILISTILLCVVIVGYSLIEPPNKETSTSSVEEIHEPVSNTEVANELENHVEQIVDNHQTEKENETNQEIDSQEPIDSSTASVNEAQESIVDSTPFDYSSIPQYDKNPYTIVNNNYPFFSDDEFVIYSFEKYSDLDELGRCGVAYANICKELMPTEERGPIGHVRPNGWHTVKYNDLIDGNYLYNRCHLIGYQLAGENDNVQNLITGTRYLNVQGMLDFENQVAEYVTNSNNHVLYRVTPIFLQNELVARGVLMEAISVEDQGNGICFNVFCYNVQPGIAIDYATGDSWREDGISVVNEDYAQQDISNTNQEAVVEELPSEAPEPIQNQPESKFVVNTKTGKIHYSGCSSVSDMSEKNKWYYDSPITELLGKTTDSGKEYSACKRCNPTD